MKYKIGDKVKIQNVTDHRKDYNGTVVTIRVINPNGKTSYKSGITHYGVKEKGIGYVFWEDELVPVNTRKIVITSDGVETLARLYDGNKVIKTATAKCSPDDTFDFEAGARIAFDRLIESPLTKALKSLRDAAAGIAKNIKPLRFEVGKQYQRGDLVIEITEADREIPRYRYKVIKGDDKGLRFFDENSIFGRGLTPYDPPKYYNGKVICVKSSYSWWTVGKVYNVVDGILTANDGDKFPKGNRTPYRDAEDIRHAGNDGFGDGRHNPANEFVPFVE